jgi:hypothetical protein
VIHHEAIHFPARGSRRRRLVLLLACWLTEGIIWVTIFGSPIPVVAPQPTRANSVTTPASTPRETGAFCAQRFDSAAGHRPLASVSWRNMRAENGRVGIFRTPLSRTLIVDGLQIKSYQYSPAAESHRDRETLTQTIGDLVSQWNGDFAGLEIEGPLVDIRRAAKVIVKDFDYSVARDGRLELDIQCRNAVVSMPGPQLVLRGGVTIEAASGDTLTSNCVLWDVQTSRFSVPGAYIFTHNGVAVSGQGIHCDQRLCPLVTQETDDTKGAGRWAQGRSF